MISNKHIRSTTAFLPTKSSSAIHLVQSSRFAQRLARLLLIGLFVLTLAMALLPWQQSSRGAGQVVAYVPQERQQTIQAPVKGVVARIANGLVEGSEVKKGDFSDGKAWEKFAQPRPSLRKSTRNRVLSPTKFGSRFRTPLRPSTPRSTRFSNRKRTSTWHAAHFHWAANHLTRETST